MSPPSYQIVLHVTDEEDMTTTHTLPHTFDSIPAANANICEAVKAFAGDEAVITMEQYSGNGIWEFGFTDRKWEKEAWIEAEVVMIEGTGKSELTRSG